MAFTSWLQGLKGILGRSATMPRPSSRTTTPAPATIHRPMTIGCSLMPAAVFPGDFYFQLSATGSVSQLANAPAAHSVGPRPGH
jgi:hypothetical protein